MCIKIVNKCNTSLKFCNIIMIFIEVLTNLLSKTIIKSVYMSV